MESYYTQQQQYEEVDLHSWSSKGSDWEVIGRGGGENNRHMTKKKKKTLTSQNTPLFPLRSLVLTFYISI